MKEMIEKTKGRFETCPDSEKAYIARVDTVLAVKGQDENKGQ
jgi:hypothetical protein